MTPPLRRGLTMLETLAATVLLAMLASACVPALHRAFAQLQDAPAERISIAALGRVADEIVKDPDLAGVENIAAFSHAVFHSASLDADVEITRLQAADGADHAWLRFACHDPVVVRWIPIEPDANDAGAAP